MSCPSVHRWWTKNPPRRTIPSLRRLEHPNNANLCRLKKTLTLFDGQFSLYNLERTSGCSKVKRSCLIAHTSSPRADGLLRSDLATSSRASGRRSVAYCAISDSRGWQEEFLRGCVRNLLLSLRGASATKQSQGLRLLRGVYPERSRRARNDMSHRLLDTQARMFATE